MYLILTDVNKDIGITTPSVVQFVSDSVSDPIPIGSDSVVVVVVVEVVGSPDRMAASVDTNVDEPVQDINT